MVDEWKSAVMQLERTLIAPRWPRLIDVVYLFRHSANGDEEIRYSLRSVAKHLPFIRKVWIFGDRPEFLTNDKSLVEHVPHSFLAPLFGFRTPVRSDFLMQFLASLIPELAPDFVRFADDYIVLQPLTSRQLMTPRALEDLNQARARGTGKYKDLVWRTYEVLKHYGFAGYNFESHVPQPLSKRLVLEAFIAFREFLSEDRLDGLLTLSSVYNYALKRRGIKFTWLHEEGARAGFYGKCPTKEEVVEQCRGRLFLNFDDHAWGRGIADFVRERFPDPSKYEGAANGVSVLETGSGIHCVTADDHDAVQCDARRDAPIANRSVSEVEQLTVAFTRATSSRGQMTPAQYFRVVTEVLNRRPCNLLIVGAGRDTELYVQANRGGKSVVLERHERWAEEVRHLECIVICVSYQSRLADGLLEPCRPPEGLPQWIMDHTWDVILVDGPEGNDLNAPGRQQSIFLASQLARPNTTVFVHDWNRPAEQSFASLYLKLPDERYGSQRTLAVFTYPAAIESCYGSPAAQSEPDLPSRTVS